MEICKELDPTRATAEAELRLEVFKLKIDIAVYGYGGGKYIDGVANMVRVLDDTETDRSSFALLQ